MAKKQGNISQLAVQLFYDSVGSTDSNQRFMIQLAFQLFYDTFPIKFHLLQKGDRSEFVGLLSFGIIRRTQ